MHPIFSHGQKQKKNKINTNMHDTPNALTTSYSLLTVKGLQKLDIFFCGFMYITALVCVLFQWMFWSPSSTALWFVSQSSLGAFELGIFQVTSN